VKYVPQIRLFGTAGFLNQPKDRGKNNFGGSNLLSRRALANGS
jgi:hypothetical protein